MRLDVEQARLSLEADKVKMNMSKIKMNVEYQEGKTLGCRCANNGRSEVHVYTQSPHTYD